MWGDCLDELKGYNMHWWHFLLAFYIGGWTCSFFQMIGYYRREYLINIVVSVFAERNIDVKKTMTVHLFIGTIAFLVSLGWPYYVIHDLFTPDEKKE